MVPIATDAMDVDGISNNRLKTAACLSLFALAVESNVAAGNARRDEQRTSDDEDGPRSGQDAEGPPLRLMPMLVLMGMGKNSLVG